MYPQIAINVLKQVVKEYSHQWTKRVKSNLEICKTIFKIGNPFVGLTEGNNSNKLKAICLKLVITTLFMMGKNERKEVRKGRRKEKKKPS